MRQPVDQHDFIREILSLAPPLDTMQKYAAV